MLCDSIVLQSYENIPRTSDSSNSIVVIIADYRSLFTTIELNYNPTFFLRGTAK